MAFDPKTAVPVDDFDPSTATLVDDFDPDTAVLVEDETAQKPKDTSFTSALMQGIDAPLEAIGTTAKVFGMPKVGEFIQGLTDAPENYDPAAPRVSEPREGDFTVAGMGVGSIPRAAVEQTGQLAGSLISRATGALAGSAIGAVAGVVGGAPSGPGALLTGAGARATGARIGAFAGPFLFEAMQIAGPTALERAKRNGRTEPNREDIIGGLTTAAASGALNAIGAKYLPGGEKAVGSYLKRITSAFFGEGATETGQAFTEQAGGSALTEEGLELRPKEALAEGLIGGTTAGGASALDIRRDVAKSNTQVDQAISEVAAAEPPPLPSAETTGGVPVQDVTAEAPARAVTEPVIVESEQDGIRTEEVFQPEDTEPSVVIESPAQPAATAEAQTASTPQGSAPEATMEETSQAEVTQTRSAAQLQAEVDSLESRWMSAPPNSQLRSQLGDQLRKLYPELEKATGKSIGPGAASVEEHLGRKAIGIKNASIDQARIERGQQPLASEARKTNAEQWDAAMDRIANDEEYAAKLVKSINEGQRESVSDIEQQALLHEEIRLRNERDMELERASDPNSSSEERIAANDAATELEKALNNTEIAARKAGSMSGRALQIRQQMMYDDFTPAAVERRLRAAKGEALTPDELAQVKEQVAKLQKDLEASVAREAQVNEEAINKAVEDALKEMEAKVGIDKRVLDYAEKIVNKWELEASGARERLRKKYFTLRAVAPENTPSDLADMVLVARAAIARGVKNLADFTAQVTKDIGEGAAGLASDAWNKANELLNKVGAELPEKRRKAVQAKIKAKAGTDAERRAIIGGIEEVAKGGASISDIGKYVKLLYRNFAESGMRGGDNITTAVHGVLKPLFPQITERDVKAAFTDYDVPPRPLPTEEAKVHLAQIRGELKKALDLEGVIERQEAPRKLQNRMPPSDLSRRLTKLLNEAKKRFNIEPSDPERALKSALESRKTYYRNKLSDLRYEIGRRERIVKEKAASPTDPELEAIKAEYEEVKAEHDAIFGKPELTDAQRVERAIRASERAEAMALKALEDAKRGVFRGKKVSPTSPELQAAQARVAAIREETRELREMSDAFKAEQEEKAIEAVKRQIDELDRKLKEGDIAPKSTAAKQMSAEREALVSQRDAMQRAILEQRKGPPRSRDEIAIQSYKARLKRQEADLLERNLRADAGDVTALETPKRRPPIDLSKDAELVRLKASVEQQKAAINRKAAEYRMANRTTRRKILDGIRQTFHAQTNLLTAFDFSALRQAAAAGFSRPVMVARAMPTMFGAWRTEQGARDLDSKRKTRPNAQNGLDERAKIEYTSLDEDTFSRKEENLRSLFDTWAEGSYRTGNAAKTIAQAPGKALAKGVRASNRAFIVFLNKVRADLFDALMAANFKTSEPTTEQLEAIGNLVNVMTGRGKLNAKVADVAGNVLWSPKLLASRVQLLTGQPLYGGDAKSRWIAGKEYIRMAAGAMASAYALQAIAGMFGWEFEDDPRSSDFGKLKIGDTRIDIWGGFQQPLVLLARSFSGITKSSTSGKTREAQDPNLFGSFVRTKVNPQVGLFLDTKNMIQGKESFGEEVTPASLAKTALIPLSAKDIATNIEEHGIAGAAALQLLSSFGAGIQTYGDAEFAKSNPRQ